VSFDSVESWVSGIEREKTHLIENDGCTLSAKGNELFELFAAVSNSVSSEEGSGGNTYAITCPVGFLGFDAITTERP